MPILKSCCSHATIKSGSFAAAIYTLIFNTIIMTAGSFHIHEVWKANQREMTAFAIIMVSLASLMVLSSILLLIGLSGDQRKLFIPWIIIMTLTIMSDLTICFHLFKESTYCLLCVVSRYQQCKYELNRLKYISSNNQSNVENNFVDLMKYKGETHKTIGKNNLDKRPAQNENVNGENLIQRNYFSFELNTISEDNENDGRQMNVNSFEISSSIDQRKISTDISTTSTELRNDTRSSICN